MRGLGRWCPVAVASVMTLGACGESGSSHPSANTQTGGSAGGDKGGSAGDENGGSQHEPPGGGAGNASVGGTAQGQAGEGPTTSSVLCKGSAPFGTPQPLASINTTDHEAGPRLTNDELTVAYLCQQGDTARVCIARRPSISAEFELQQEAIPRQGGVPWISDDELILIYEDDSEQTLNFARRDAPDAAFEESASIASLSGYGDPYVVGGENGRLYLSDGDLYFAQLQGWLPAMQEPLLGTGEALRTVRPVLTTDELTLYFGLDSPITGLDIWRRQRAGTDQPFGDATEVSELNDGTSQFPSWISPDGCRIYFDSGDTERDLYVAQRAP